MCPIFNNFINNAIVEEMKNGGCWHVDLPIGWGKKEELLGRQEREKIGQVTEKKIWITKL